VPSDTQGVFDGLDSKGNVRVTFNGFGTRLLDGSDAQECLETSKLSRAPLEIKVDLIVQLLEAITRLIRNGILHRDITPSNIMVFGDCLSPHGCRLKLADFGLACGGNVSRCTGNPGTRWYIPPESCLPGGIVETDVWAAGLTAFEILVGRQPLGWDDHPFKTKFKSMIRLVKLQEVRRAYLQHSPMRDPGLGAYPELRPLLAGMLEMNPCERFVPMEALMEAKKVARMLSEGVLRPSPHPHGWPRGELWRHLDRGRLPDVIARSV